MTELYLIELMSYLDMRRILLGEDIAAERRRVRDVWYEHFNHEVDHPNLFPVDQVREQFNTEMVPVHWSTALVTKEML